MNFVKQIITFPLIAMYELRKNKIFFFFLLAGFMGFLLYYIDLKTDDTFKSSFWGGVLVEAHGMFLDVILFGILLTIYEKFTEKKNEINRLKEEIDDYRHWNQPEATYRIVGCIKRLQKLKCKTIDLSDCFLETAQLEGIHLKNCILKNVNLKNANLRFSYFENCVFKNVDLSNSLLLKTKFRGSTMVSVNLNNSNLLGSKLYLKTFIKIDFKDVKVSRKDFSEIDLKKFDLYPDYSIDGNDYFFLKEAEDTKFMFSWVGNITYNMKTETIYSLFNCNEISHYDDKNVLYMHVNENEKFEQYLREDSFNRLKGFRWGIDKHPWIENESI